MDQLVTFVDSLLFPEYSTGDEASPNFYGQECGANVRQPELHEAEGQPLDKEQYMERWADEVMALQAIYGADMTCIAEGAVRIRVRARNGDSTSRTDSGRPLTRKCAQKGRQETETYNPGTLIESERGETPEGLWISFARTERYPDTHLLIELQNWVALSHHAEDELFESLLETAQSQLGNECIYTLAELAVEFYTAHLEAEADRQLAKEMLLASRVNSDTKIGLEKTDTDEGWFEHRPSQFAGSVIEVLGSLPKNIGVLNVENVLREDLAELFVMKQKILKKKHPKLEDAGRVMRMFHGTAMTNVPSIVRQGLMVPGESSGVKVVHGSTFGKGIYLSPDASYSSAYCYQGQSESRLLVCAALPGWPERTTRVKVQSAPRGVYDCRVSGNELEWIFFDAAQVLPCYVIHFHAERLRGFMYHELSAAGALVKVQGENSTTLVPSPAAKIEEALAGEMAARKRAEFYFGKRVKILDWSPPDDDDDADEQMVYKDAACSHLSEDGDQEEYSAEYQAARYDGGWNVQYARGVVAGGRFRGSED